MFYNIITTALSFKVTMPEMPNVIGEGGESRFTMRCRCVSGGS